MPNAKPMTTESSARQRILVISADPRLRERLYDTLSRHDFLVSTAGSLENGLETLQQGESFHLILLDSAVNRGKHVSFTDRIRHFDDTLPIILLAHPDQAPVDTPTIRHIQACLPRDAEDQALLAIISRWLPPPRPFKTIQYPGPILIVDDEVELLKHLEDFLQTRGCTVVKAASGEEALAQLARCRPALVLLDIKMPGMDGLVTLKKIKTLRPDLPVIMATAVEDQELMMQASVLGAYEYLLKPYNLAVFEELLSRLKKRVSKPFAASTS